MNFMSRITANKKMVNTICSLFVLIFITLCVLYYNLFVKVDRLTNPNYFTPISELHESNELVEFNEDSKDIEHLDLNELKNILLEKAYIAEDEQIIFKSPDNSEMDIISEVMRNITNTNEGSVEEAKALIGSKFSEKMSKNLMTSLNANDVKVEIADTYILCVFIDDIYRYAYMYLNNGRINKSVGCLVGERLYSASNTNNESFNYNDGTQNDIDFGVNDADREEFMLDLQQGLVPRMEVYTLEYISEYINKKHSKSTNHRIESLALILRKKIKEFIQQVQLKIRNLNMSYH